jgi:hypothetical protein
MGKRVGFVLFAAVLWAIGLCTGLVCGATADAMPAYKRGARVGGSTAVVDSTAPTDGAALTLTAGDTTLGLSWDAATDSVGVDHYRVCMATGTQTPPANCSCTPPTGCGDGSGTSCTATGLTNRTNYAFRVCAVDAIGNTSTGLTGTEQPYVDAQAWTFDGCDTAGGCAGTEEYVSFADNAVFEVGNHYTAISIQTVTTCASGVPCDDFIWVKGTNANDSYSGLVEFNASGWVPRVAIGALGQFLQSATAITLNRRSVVVATYDGTQVDGGDAGTDANAERLSLYQVTCSNATPAVCGSLTDVTAAGTFLGTIPTTISDQATAFTVGGVPATRFNLAGSINEIAIYADGKISTTDIQNCVLDGTHARFRNLNRMSSACDAVFAHRVVWLSFGDRPGDAPATTIANGFANAITTGTPNAMESGDQAAHGN